MSEIDKIPFGSYHIRAILVAGVGFFLDSYDIFAINVITIWLGLAFWSGPPEDAHNGFGGNYGALPTPVSQALKASTSAGIVIGMVVFGCLADAVGRRKMYGIELIVIIVATLLCALVNPSQSINSTALLTFWRVIMVSPHRPCIREYCSLKRRVCSVLTHFPGRRYRWGLSTVFCHHERVSCNFWRFTIYGLSPPLFRNCRGFGKPLTNNADSHLQDGEAP